LSGAGPDHPLVPLVDLAAVHQPLLDELQAAFERVLSTSGFIGGVEVERFEAALAARTGAAHAVAVGSGTAALHLALLGAGIGPGDEVVVPALTFVATAEAVLATGAVPVLADVDRATALLDPVSVEHAVTARTAAVVPVHLYGQTADADRFRALADRHGLFLLEDAAQAIGAAWAGRPAGSLGDAAGFSFYPTKNLGALGDGGAVTTDDEGLARRVRLLRSHGEESKNHHVLAGFSERLDGLQAAFLSAKLAHLDSVQARRDGAAEHYRRHLPAIPGVELLTVAAPARHVHHLLVVRVPNRDAVLAALRDHGVGAAVHYPTPLHLQPACERLGKVGDFPAAEALAASVLSLPLYPGITVAQLDHCMAALAQVIGPSS
jgi:dTDP-4-amino-4,6-dideoxygalactose transaminase